MTIWKAVDLDGTLVKYVRGKWQGPLVFGEPIPEMVERVRRWLAAGEDVRIFTARVSEDDPAIVEAIEGLCVRLFGQILPVTNDARATLVEARTAIQAALPFLRPSLPAGPMATARVRLELALLAIEAELTAHAGLL